MLRARANARCNTSTQSLRTGSRNHAQKSRLCPCATFLARTNAHTYSRRRARQKQPLRVNRSSGRDRARGRRRNLSFDEREHPWPERMGLAASEEPEVSDGLGTELSGLEMLVRHPGPTIMRE
jgi:hypothetical protein